MRTPNAFCVICIKPLYRKPHELKKVRFTACRKHLDVAKKQFGMTPEQAQGLASGRRKGNGGRLGRPHKSSSRQKASISHKKWCAENPEKVAARGKKNRAEDHYGWKGGTTKFNKSIRQMTENITWAREIKQRDRCCQRCGSNDHLEAHHIESLEELIARLKLQTRDDCRKYADIIRGMKNGITLCRHCHFRHHGRGFSMKIDQSTFEKMPHHLQQMFVKIPDPVVALFPTSSVTGKRSEKSKSASVAGTNWLMDNHQSTEYTDSGSAARFFESYPFDDQPVFYQAKAGKDDRAGSKHPTVKPIALMQALVRHVTPPGGTVLDPFAGSGTTGEAALREGFNCILMEAEPEYIEFLTKRFNSIEATQSRVSTDLTEMLS